MCVHLKPCTMNSSSGGIGVGIDLKGAEDDFVSRRLMTNTALKGGRYASSYGRQEFHHTRSGSFDLAQPLDALPRMDMLGELDLVIHNPDDLSLSELFTSIEIETGGTIIDGWRRGDIATQIELSNAIFGRKMRRYGALTLIPLTLAPFNADLLWPVTAAARHRFTIRIKSVVPDLNIQFWGRRYVMDRTDCRPPPYAGVKEDDEGRRDRWAQVWDRSGKKRVLEWAIHQHQKTAETFAGEGTHRQEIFFSHPLNLIALWGLDLDLITGVRVEVNGQLYDSWTVAELEHIKFLRGWTVAPLIIPFGDDGVSGTARSSLNFSRIETCDLVIDTAQQNPCTVHLAGIGIQIMRVAKGLTGTVFSK